jgi:hypothetical protein
LWMCALKPPALHGCRIVRGITKAVIESDFIACGQLLIGERTEAGRTLEIVLAYACRSAPSSLRVCSLARVVPCR